MDFEASYKLEIELLFDILKEYTKKKYNFDVKDMDEVKSPSRKRPLVNFRKIMMVVLFETFGSKPYKFTQEEIAKAVGKDRTSLIHHSKIHLDWYTRYPDYKEEFDKISEEFERKMKKNPEI